MHLKGEFFTKYIQYICCFFFPPPTCRTMYLKRPRCCCRVFKLSTNWFKNIFRCACGVKKDKIRKALVKLRSFAWACSFDDCAQNAPAAAKTEARLYHRSSRITSRPPEAPKEGSGDVSSYTVWDEQLMPLGACARARREEALGAAQPPP